jgi:hypothetical protein
MANTYQIFWGDSTLYRSERVDFETCPVCKALATTTVVHPKKPTRRGYACGSAASHRAMTKACPNVATAIAKLRTRIEELEKRKDVDERVTKLEARISKLAGAFKDSDCDKVYADCAANPGF